MIYIYIYIYIYWQERAQESLQREGPCPAYNPIHPFNKLGPIEPFWRQE